MIFGKILYNVPRVIFQNGLKFQNITTNHAITYTYTQEKLETMAMQNLGGKQGVLWSMWKWQI